jgi:hypothetical protein
LNLNNFCNFVILTLTLGNAFAADAQKTLQNGTLKETFYWNKRLETWVSQKCNNNKSPCGAVKLLHFAKELKSSLNEAELIAGQNPATYTCKKVGGKLRLFYDAKKNEWYFCEADDRSMISVSAFHRL